MSKVNNIILTLRVYSGKKLYDANGKLVSKNQTMKLAYARLEWTNFLKSVAMFYSEVQIESATEEIIKDGKKEYKDTKIPADAISDVKKAIGVEDGAKEAKKADKKESPKVEEPVKESTDESLEAVRKEYLEVFGKKPNHLAKEATLRKKIDEKLAE